MTIPPPPLTVQPSKTVIVSASSTSTARSMLHIATGIVDVKEGRILLLMVTEGASEQTNERAEALRPLVEETNASGFHAKLITQIASSVSRGILDAVRENNADVLILGVQKNREHEVKLGTIVENVLDVAPCDVLVYRSPLEYVPFKRVVAPLSGNLQSLVALVNGVTIANGRDVPLRVQYLSDTYHDGLDEWTQPILEKANQQRLQRQFITSAHQSARVLKSLKADDLLILGFSHKTALERILTDSASDRLLNEAPCAVLLASHIAYETTPVGRIRRRLQRFSPLLTQAERSELSWNAEKTAAANIDYLMMAIFAAGLATLGLVSNSVAVIIGAMLVAPLMTPLIAFATALSTMDIEIARRAFTTLAQGVLLALLISVVLGWIFPNQLTSEMLARGNPSIADAGVALFSGLVAAYANARKDVPAALAGVAIAAALMPPVCTIGLGMAYGNPALSLGATLLFLTNISWIIFGGTMTFIWLGMRATESSQWDKARTAVLWLFLGVVMVFTLFLLGL